MQIDTLFAFSFMISALKRYLLPISDNIQVINKKIEGALVAVDDFITVCFCQDTRYYIWFFLYRKDR